MHADMWIHAGASKQTLEMIARTEKKKYRHMLGAALELEHLEDAVQAEQRFADAVHLKYDKLIFGNTLYKNLSHGKFEEVSDQAGMETWWPWGIATGDFDNDGYEDVFLPSGMGYPYLYWGNMLMMNNRDGTFTNRAAAAGIEPPRRGIYQEENIGHFQAARSSRCAAVADFRGDGRLDIIVNNFNDSPYYFRNNFPKKNYIAFRLQGAKTGPDTAGSNRDAIGALVRIYLGQEVMVRQVNPAGGYLSQSSKTVHIGLGDRTRIDRVEIKWPGSSRWPRGHVQVLEHPDINKLHEIVEPRS
jgi:hypothetical protein